MVKRDFILSEMAALYKEVDFVYDNVIQLDEYKNLISNGFIDISSNQQKKNLNIVFLDNFEVGLMWQVGIAGVLRKMLSSSKVVGDERWARVYQMKPAQYQQDNERKAISLEEYNGLFKVLQEKSGANKRRFVKKEDGYKDKFNDIMKKLFEDERKAKIIKKGLNRLNEFDNGDKDRVVHFLIERFYV